MKLPACYHRPTRGMARLECVVLLLLAASVLAVLYVGSVAWRRGNDRAGCLARISQTQHAVRAFQNTYGLSCGAPVELFPQVIGPGQILTEAPVCPARGTYTSIRHVPFPGELVIRCSLGQALDHVPPVLTDW